MVNVPLIGADPEFFLFDKVEGRHVSAHGLVPGNKEKPHKVKKGAVQLDGTAVEFNIDPTSKPDEFAEHIKEVLAQLRAMIPNQYEFKFSPIVNYEPEYFDQGVPQSSKELGCNPDFRSDNLRVLTKNRLPAHAEENPFRTASGHIHVGWCKDKDAVKDEDHAFDTMMFSNVLGKILQPIRWYWDLDDKRHKLYGMNYAYRPKPYGVEYRGLSNAWLNHPELWPWLHKLVTLTFQHMVRGDLHQHKAFDACWQSGLNAYAGPNPRDRYHHRAAIGKFLELSFGKGVAPEIPVIEKI